MDNSDRSGGPAAEVALVVGYDEIDVVAAFGEFVRDSDRHPLCTADAESGNEERYAWRVRHCRNRRIRAGKCLPIRFGPV